MAEDLSLQHAPGPPPIDELAERRARELSLRKLNAIKWYMELLRFVCRVRLADPDDDLERPREFHRHHQRGSVAHHGHQRQHGRAYAAFKLLSNFFMLNYIASVLHMTLNLYHQYKLDISLLRLRQLGSSGWPGQQRDQRQLLVEQLNRTSQLSYEALSLIGAPSGRMHFAIECYFLMEILISFIVYLGPQVVLNHVLKLDIYHMRILIDYKRELQLCQRAADEQVALYLESARNHSRVLAHSSWAARRSISDGSKAARWPPATPGGGGGGLGAQPGAPSRKSRASASCPGLSERLAQMNARHELLPFNRRPEWVNSWIKHFILLATLHSFNNLCFETYSVSSLYLSESSKPVRDWTLADCLLIWASYILFGALSIPTTFYSSLFLLALTDTVKLVQVLRGQIDECVRRLERLVMPQTDIADFLWLAEGRARAQGLGARACSLVRERQLDLFYEHHRLPMNGDILYILMHYKIFIRQLRTQKNLFVYMVLSSTVVLFVLPIISGLHMPYFGDDLDQGMRSFLTILNLCIIGPTSLAFLQACRIVSRANDLHKSMMRLLARTIYVAYRAEFRHFYDAHLVLLLRREICIHVGMDKAFGVAGIAFNYANVMRFYFWLGLTITAVVSRTRAGAHAAGRARSFFDDPLGVYL